MKHIDKRLHNPPWQVLGELELPVGTNIDHEIQRWLTLILGPLRLPEDFLKKLLKSAQGATERAVEAEAVLKAQHIHLLVFALADHAQKGQTWGFFRVERLEKANTESAWFDHAIEFYLYLEGQ